MTKVLIVDEDHSFFQEFSDRISELAKEITVLFASSGHRACEIFDCHYDIDIIFIGGVKYFTDEINRKNLGSDWFLEHVARPCNNHGRKDNLVVATCDNQKESLNLIKRGCHTTAPKNQIINFVLDFLGV